MGCDLSGLWACVRVQVTIDTHSIAEDHFETSAETPEGLVQGDSVGESSGEKPCSDDMC